MTYKEHLAADIRLTILRALADMPDRQLNTTILSKILDEFGHRITREDLQNHLVWLAGEEIGAVVLIERGSIMIANLTKIGLEHVERRRVIEGILQPSPEL